MIIQGQVGPINSAASISSGTQTIARYGNMGDQIVSELHGRYYEAAYRKTLFTAGVSTPIVAATTANPTTTITGAQVLYNPIGNAFNLVLQKVSFGFVLANIANAIGIGTGFNATTNLSGTLTAVTATAKNRFLNGPAPTGQSYASASITLPTAITLDTLLFTTGSAATTVPAVIGPLAFDLEGSIILPPGGYATVWSSAAIPTTSLLTTFSWEEVPI
jgi:hypothetical protein